jgi:hypothetical protein
MAGIRIEDLPAYGAVDLAKVPGDIFEVSKNSGTSGSPIYLPADSHQIRMDELAALIGAVIPGGYIPLLEENYLVVTLTDSETDNGENLRDAITYAIASTPYGNALATDNRFTVFLFPGTYDLGATGIKTLLALPNWIQVVGIGDPRNIIITSSDSDGTFQAKTNEEYTLENFTIKNSGGGKSIFHAAAATDIGIWKNLRLYAGNTEGTDWQGYYEGLTGLDYNILNGSISSPAIVKGCTFMGQSCGYSSTTAIVISGRIEDCAGEYNSFGHSPIGVTISGSIKRCSATFLSFGYSSAGNVTISGLIYSCISLGGSFGFVESAATLTISGAIISCRNPVGSGAANCFGSSNAAANLTLTATGIFKDCYSDAGYSFMSISGAAGVVDVSGVIEDCRSNNVSFGTSVSGGTVTISGRIRNCHDTSGNGSGFGFSGSGGTTTISGIIELCAGGYLSFGASYGTVVISGLIKDCTGIGSANQTFGSAQTGPCTISGMIVNCHIKPGANGYASFGYSQANVTISGKIISCSSDGNQCFGNANN